MVVPYAHRIILLTSDYPSAWRRLQATTYDPRWSQFVDHKPVRDFSFVGQLKEGSFRLTRQLGHPDNYSPQLSGHLEAAGTGSLLEVTYKPLGGTRVALVVWTLLTLALALIFILSSRSYLYALIALGAGLSNYIITVANFSRRVKRTQQHLLALLENKPT